MNPLIYWYITGFILLLFAGLIGRKATYIDNGEEKTGHWLGILIDDRMRFSLTHFQLVSWTLVFLSLLCAIILIRLFKGEVSNILEIKIPSEILILIGISGGSAVIATATKSTRTDKIRHFIQTEKKSSRLSQIFMKEEVEVMDKVIDTTKFQNFFLTIIALVAYIIMAAITIKSQCIPDSLPGFGEDLLWLIGVSHTTYIGGKFPESKFQNSENQVNIKMEQK